MSTQSFLYRENTFRQAETRQPLWNHFLKVAVEWRRRAQSRRELARLSSLEMKDFGYPAAAEVEKRKPFWKK